jgi:AcrR family transcriptional regulator
MERGGTRRDAIVEGMIRAAGRKGYLATSVADVIAEADVSRTTFYKHFDDKQACFLAAYDLAVGRIIAAAEASCEGRRNWRKRAVAGLAAMVELLAAEPALARIAVVEAAPAGPKARDRHRAAIARLGRLLEPHDEPELRPDLPSNTALMAVGAVAGLVFDELRKGRTADLTSLLPELEFALLVPFLGPRAAVVAHSHGHLASAPAP